MKNKNDFVDAEAITEAAERKKFKTAAMVSVLENEKNELTPIAWNNRHA